MKRGIIFIVIIIFIGTGIYFLYQNNQRFNSDKIMNAETEKNINEINQEVKEIIALDTVESRDKKRKSDIHALNNVLEEYYKKNNNYPETIVSEQISNKNSKVYLDLKNSNLIDKLYQDPLDKYYYGYKSNGLYFELSARLENKEDKDCVVKNDDLCLYIYTSLRNVSIKNTKSENDLISRAYASLSALYSKDVEEIILITSAIPNDIHGYTDETINALESEGNIKVLRTNEVSQEYLSSKNVLIIGDIDTNDFISDAYSRTEFVIMNDIFEDGSFKMVMKTAENPWNKEKIIVVGEKDYLLSEMFNIEGKIEIKEISDSMYQAILTDINNNVFVLVSNSTCTMCNFENLHGKEVLVKGYKRYRNSKKFPIEESISVSEINIL